MSWEQITLVVLLVAMMAGLSRRRMSPTVGVLGCLLAVFVLGIGDAETSFAGFSNRAPLTIGALYVIAGAVQHTGALATVVQKLAGESGFSRVLAGSAVVSAFVANTPVVAILIGPVLRWAKEHRISPSRLLIPLSYATILGGMTTLIGTSTNLVGSGIIETEGLTPLSFFEPARFGLPVAIAGLAIAMLGGKRLLPERGQDEAGAAADKTFTVACIVKPDGPYDGVKVEEGGLRNLPGMFLVAMTKPTGELIAPVGPDQLVSAGDVLSFAGAVDEVVGIQNQPGLELAESNQLDALSDDKHAWFEAVVGNGSQLVGRTLKQVNFRSQYNAAVVALRRSGRPFEGKLGTERIQMGDSLLVVADLGFAQRWNKRSDFLLIRRRSEPPPTASTDATKSLLILGLVVALSITGAVDVLRASIIGAVLTVLSGVLTPRQARDSVDLNVVVLIGAAIGLGGVISVSGLADKAAMLLTTAFEPFGVWGVALGVTLAALLLTELVTNAGAVAITVPIAIAAATDIGAEPRVFALVAITAASASFLTPIGYQTNTMVYGPGNYHFTDYLRLGIPITISVLILLPVMAALA